MLALWTGERPKKRILQSMHDSWKRLYDAKLCSVRSSMQQENNQRPTDMDMQGASDMSKQSLFNELLEDLIDACADYREAEHPGSGQGSWTRSQLYAGVLRSVRDIVDAVNNGAGGSDVLGAGASAGATQQATVEPCICDEAELTISCVCSACGGAVANE